MVTKKVRVDGDVRDVLAGMAWEQDGTLGRIERQLDRDLYVLTNKVLEMLGGKWNRGKKGHVFSQDPRQFVEGLAENGEMDLQVFDAFYTPLDVVERMIYLANIEPGMEVLEPSAGDGRIVKALLATGAKVRYCEIDPQSIAVLLRIKEAFMTDMDFLKLEEWKFDRVVMNPPFSKRQWIAHVKHAFDLLKPGGRLVSVVPYGYKDRQDDWGVAYFEDWLGSKKWDLYQLPEGTFKEAGTGVNTAILVIDK